VLPGVGGVTGANRTGVELGGTSRQGSRPAAPRAAGTGHTSDLTAMLVWGMVQR
jgi:hypothetical protein